MDNYLFICGMEKKYKKIEHNNDLWVNEPTIAYQRTSSTEGVTRMMTQKELNSKCFTIEESKNRILTKINRHFHNI